MIAKLVQTTPISLWFMIRPTHFSVVFTGFKSPLITSNWGGHIVAIELVGLDFLNDL